MLETHAVVLADRSGTICVWSAGAETLFGCAAQTAIGTRLDLIVPGGYRESHWAAFNCSGSADPADTLLTLRNDAGVSVSTDDCPGMSETIAVLGASLHLWGDVDCSGAVDPIESLKLPGADAGPSVSQAAGCPEIGSTVQTG